MSLRIGVLTHIVCDCCGRRCRVKSIVPTESDGTFIEFRCSGIRCLGETAMSLGSYRLYGGEARRLDLVSVHR